MISRAMTADADLRDLIAAAEAFDSDYERDQMPAYNAVLAHMQKHPAHRADFGFMLLARLKEHGDGHLFMFCMGALKWPEVEAELRRWSDASASETDKRPHFFYASCLRCFDPNYEFP